MEMVHYISYPKLKLGFTSYIQNMSKMCGILKCAAYFSWWDGSHFHLIWKTGGSVRFTTQIKFCERCGDIFQFYIQAYVLCPFEGILFEKVTDIWKEGTDAVKSCRTGQMQNSFIFLYTNRATTVSLKKKPGRRV